MSEVEGLHLRRYQGFMADSARWERFTFRPDDVVISTPSKCGTTWMQNIVGMLLLDRTDLGAPISTFSPWLDMLIRDDAEVFGLLERQAHRRFIKTHTPLDGVPRHESVTYIAVARHPLDVALSDWDHCENAQHDRAVAMRVAASGPVDADLPVPGPSPDDRGDFLRWFIDNGEPPTGSGPNGLADYCQQIRTYWEARHAPNVHLFHYGDMSADLDAQMRRVATALKVEIDEDRWPAFVGAAEFISMRSRANEMAPDANLGIWVSPEEFFRSGGTRDWDVLLSAHDVTHFQERLEELAGHAADWAISGARGE
ncbi:MAG: sulfotransferase domain-containing protein [Actinomycetia bacterium]|nr:sulfotransferase domain-containing protein [Actinomycetes bacterium]